MRQPSAKMCRLRDVAKILVTEKPAMSLDGEFADEEGACALVRTSHLVQIALLVLVVLEAAVHASLRHPRRGRPWRVHEPRLVSGDAQRLHLPGPEGPRSKASGPFRVSRAFPSRGVGTEAIPRQARRSRMFAVLSRCRRFRRSSLCVNSCFHKRMRYDTHYMLGDCVAWMRNARGHRVSRAT